MSPDDSQTAPSSSERDEFIDMRYVVHAVWSRRAIVLSVLLLGVAIGTLSALLNVRHFAQGLLLIPEFRVEDFKRYQVALLNRPALEEFLRLSGEPDSAASKELRRLTSEPTEAQEAIRPEFAYTDRDAKQFSVRFDEPGQLLGVSFRIRHRDQKGRNPVILMSEYYRDTMILVDLQQEIFRQCAELGTREQELRNEQIDNDFSIAQHRAKAGLLRAIVDRNPDVSALETRQVVSVRNGGEKFLTPLAQMVGEEAAAADLEVRQAWREREMTVSRLKKEYYCRARDLLGESLTGRTLLERLPVIQEDVFAGLDPKNQAHERAANDLRIEREKWHDKYLVRSRFVAPPEGATVTVRSPTLVVGVVLGLFMGGLIGVLIAVALRWLRTNRRALTDDE